MDNIIKVLTDPVSNRILQMIRVKGRMTVSEILSDNDKLPRATLYRKIDKMLEVGAIYIADTNKVRGQIENVYAIKNIYVSNENSNQEKMKTITLSLMKILDLYDRYFQSQNADVDRDKLFLFNYAIKLSDKNYSDMMKDIFKIVDKYQHKSNSDNVKLRNLYLLSAPGGEDSE